jgi:hypothetical protein
MKRVTSIIQRILPNDIPRTPNGRWKLEYCDRKLDNKVELSNEDNCGACNQYALTKNELNNKNISVNSNTKVI